MKMTEKEKKEYWLPVSLWNFNELFTTESVSPYIFYRIRGFGNPSARQLEPGENEEYLLLYRQAPKNGPAIKINPTSLDERYLQEADGYSLYYRTIYLRRGDFVCYFENDAQIQLLTMNSRMLLEVKAIEKHRFRGNLSFEPFQLYNHKICRGGNPQIEKRADKGFDFKVFTGFDRALNQLKGLVFGLYRGILSQPGAKAMELENVLRSWRNAIGTARTNIAMTSEYNAGWTLEIKRLGERVAELYEKDSSGTREALEILRLRLSEIDKLYQQKAEELEKQNAPSYQLQYQECLHNVEQARQKLSIYEDSAGIADAKIEIQEIKDLEKQNGVARGKSREYFSKDSWQARRKVQLKEMIAAFSSDVHYSDLDRNLSRLEEQLKQFSFGGSKYDSTIDDQFSRISVLVSDILDHTKTRAQSTRSTSRFPKLSGLKLNIDLLITYQDQNNFEKAPVPKFIEQLPDQLHLDGSSQKLLMIAMNAALATAMENQGNISNTQMLHFVELLGRSLSEEKSSKIDEGIAYAVEHLRNYISYKRGRADSFEYPQGNLILRNIFAFILRPNGFESLEKLTNEKGISPSYFATTIWAGIMGFADLPKTYTEVVYDSLQEEHFTELDNYLEAVSKLP